MIRLIVSYIAMSHILKKYETVKNDTIDKLVIRINNESKHSVHFKLVNAPDITTPFLLDFYKPIIVLPVDLHQGNYELHVDGEYKGTVTQIFDDSLTIVNRQGYND